MITHDSINKDVDKVVDMFTTLEADIFKNIINQLKSVDINDYDQSNILSWQLKQLASVTKLNASVIRLVAQRTGNTINSVEDMLRDNGVKIVNDIDKGLSDLTGQTLPVGDDIKNIINSVSRGAKTDLANVVNQTLLTRNVSSNSAVRVFQDIVTKSTLSVVGGIKTPEKALNDNIYQWVSKGLPTNPTDKAGRNWTLENYARSVIGTTAHNTFNDLRLKRINDYGIGQALMSSHHSAREACAPIQGHVVNVVPVGASGYNSRCDSIYNHGYGTPAGTQGINCHHTLTPFVPGTSSIPDGFTGNVPTPEEAEANADIVARQRQLERAIRASKKKLNTAQNLGDADTVQRMNAQIANQQAKIRDLIDANDWLQRDYSREQVPRI